MTTFNIKVGPGSQVQVGDATGVQVSDNLDDFFEKLNAIPAVQCQNALKAMHDLCVWMFCNGIVDLDNEQLCWLGEY